MQFKDAGAYASVSGQYSTNNSQIAPNNNTN